MFSFQSCFQTRTGVRTSSRTSPEELCTFSGTSPASPLVKSPENIRVSPCDNTAGESQWASGHVDDCRQKHSKLLRMMGCNSADIGWSSFSKKQPNSSLILSVLGIAISFYFAPSKHDITFTYWTDAFIQSNLQPGGKHQSVSTVVTVCLVIGMLGCQSSEERRRARKRSVSSCKNV